MKVIEGRNASGKTHKVLNEFNNKESVLILPHRTILVYTKGKEMKCKLNGSLTFGEKYRNYLDAYDSNQFGIQYRGRRKSASKFCMEMIDGYYNTFKNGYKFIVVDLDIPKQYIEECNISDDKLIVTVINNHMDGFREYSKLA